MVGDKFGMGMDDTHMAIRGAPVLDEPALSPEQKMIADKLTVSELMSMAVVALPPIVRVRPSLLMGLGGLGSSGIQKQAQKKASCMFLPNHLATTRPPTEFTCSSSIACPSVAINKQQ